ncbi:O-antigen ligase family protein [Lactobacillus crispatus]|uniref:O-antigen ligase family protein n=1 Tax=Lactobacillus crispatus TaxID=47770 RepID=UPI0015EB90C9|nr:O-antigen ligase family protein [Lactobacillus crispatus]MBA2915961.1 O-antigen ligase family protein [Lactobacillus crispatus]
MEVNSKKYWSTIFLFITWLVTVWFGIRTHSNIEYLAFWLFILLIGIVLRKNLKIELSSTEIIWGVFVFYTLLTTIFNLLIGTSSGINTNPISSNMINFVIPMIAIFILTQSSNKTVFMKLFRDFIGCFTLLGVFEYITHNQFYKSIISFEGAKNNFSVYGDINLADYRTTLIFYHPYFYSVLLVAFLICLLYLPYKNKLIQIMAWIFGLVNLFLTQTRSNWISLVLVLGLFYVKQYKKRNHKIVYFLVTVATIFIIIEVLSFIVPILFPQFSDLIVNVFNSRISIMFNGGVNDASGARLTQLNLIKYLTTLPLQLFGGGDNFALHLIQIHPVSYWTISVDNHYLVLLMDYGIVGLIIYGYFIVKCIKEFNHARSNDDALIYLILISIFISSIFFSIYKPSEINYLMFILIGLTGVRNKSTDFVTGNKKYEK